MTCLDITTKLSIMIDSLQTAKVMLNNESTRGETKKRLEEDIQILKEDIKGMYMDLYKIISN